MLTVPPRAVAVAVCSGAFEGARPRGALGKPLAALAVAGETRGRTATIGSGEANPSVQVASPHYAGRWRFANRGRVALRCR